MEKKYNFVYKTTHKESGKYYIGVHSTDNMNDGYLGSGTRIKRSVEKYGEGAFEREILRHFDTNVDAYSYEKKLVTLDTLKDTLCMNVATGGKGGYTGKHSYETKLKISESSMGNTNLKGFKFSEESKKKMSRDRSGEKNSMYGKGHLLSGKKNGMYGKGYLISGEKNGFFGRRHSDETKKKIRETKGTKIIFKGERYDSYNEAKEKTGFSKYHIKKECIYIK